MSDLEKRLAGEWLRIARDMHGDGSSLEGIMSRLARIAAEEIEKARMDAALPQYWRHAVPESYADSPIRCPFCARKQGIPSVLSTSKDAGPYWVHCQNCDARGPEGGGVEHALMLWQMRVDPKLADGADGHDSETSVRVMDEGRGGEVSENVRGEQTRQVASASDAQPSADSVKVAEPPRPDSSRIATRCPACLHPSLFIGKGGWITCSNLECKEPGLERSIAVIATQARAEAFEECAKIAEEAAASAPALAWASGLAAQMAKHVAAAIRAAARKGAKGE